jgi:hypothetical protein
MFRIIGALLGLAILLWLALWAWQFSDSYSRDRLLQDMADYKENLGTRLKVLANNIHEEIYPSRSRPISTMEQEDNLKLFAPQLFRRFSHQDWNDFWALIYESFYDKKGGFRARRYHSKDEVEAYLAEKYKDPFAKLNKKGWDAFWQILGKDRGLKMITYGIETTGQAASGESYRP